MTEAKASTVVMNLLSPSFIDGIGAMINALASDLAKRNAEMMMQ